MHPRTLLFVPGDRPDRFEKAAASGADGVIIDLEDAVVPAHKDSARYSAIQWVTDHQALIRINPGETELQTADLAALQLASARSLTGVVIPKCESHDDVHRVHKRLPGVPVIALVETARGVQNAANLATADGVTRIAFGNLDFALDAHITPTPPDEPELELARSILVIASRAAGLPSPLDGVLTDIHDTDALTAASIRSRRSGFGGRLCIHPNQVPVVALAYRPTPTDLAWARRVLAADDTNPGTVIQVDGRMIDRPLLDLARAYLNDGQNP